MEEVTIHRRHIWQGPSWSLQEVNLSYPDGATVRRGLVQHPGSVLLIPLLDERVLMIRQFRLALGQDLLELPAGTRHPDETYAQCAQRELREETGYRAGTLTPLGYLWLAPGISNERMEIFLAEALEPDPLPGDRDETIRVETFAPRDVGRLALAGELPDAKSALGILRLLSLRGELALL